MLFKKDDLIYKCGASIEDAKLIQKFQKVLQILNNNGEGFCIDSRQLHTQLGVGRDYTNWIKGRISKYDFEENVDFITVWYNAKNGVAMEYNGNNNSMKALGGTISYLVTIDMAKELCMIENNEIGKITRKYFIKCEKMLKELYEWDMIRNPEKTMYKELCEELRLFRLRNYNKETKNFHYMNEANAINQITLGANSKEIREYIEAQDKNTRDWLNKQYNTYICKIQELDILYLKMNMDRERRYEMLKQSFKALYPNATFIMANKDLKRNIEEGKYL